MTLATVDKNSNPSARIVLLKFINENGFAFFTNYKSKKGTDLQENPNAALVFFWPELERQVRVKGKVEKLDESISDEYFQSRPKESRISAIISPQSKPIPNRGFLENKFKDFIENNTEINRPTNWGGFILLPSEIEFWQGRENRLHDRFLFTKKAGIWEIRRLAP
jgi:pyridoxamine 5'-phosphate oxidase